MPVRKADDQHTKRALVILGRIAFAGWLLLLAVVGLASLVATPWPFVLIAFSVGGLPVWLAAGRWLWVITLMIALLATAVPVLLLVSYGGGEGGVSGVEPTIEVTGVLLASAYGLAWLGAGMARLVWLPMDQHS